jgi:hypothetical protein
MNADGKALAYFSIKYIVDGKGVIVSTPRPNVIKRFTNAIYECSK